MNNNKFSRNNRRRSSNNKNMDSSDVRTKNTGRVNGSSGTTTVDPTDWMIVSDVISKGVASISFNTAAGALIDLGLPSNINCDELNSIPGVMSLKYMPTPGISTNNNSAVNLAARAMYSYVRHANSGHSNYDAPDLMMYFLAMDSMYSFLSWARRLYGYLSFYTQYSRYVPRALIEANGVNYDSLMSDPAKFRSSLNLLIQSAGALVIPGNLGFIKKHMWMASNCYLDDMSVKAQLYQFVPSGYWKYNETSGPGHLNFTSYSDNHLMTLDEVIAAGRDIINPLVLSEDINIMSGDILKAYGTDGIFKVGLIEEDYSVVPSYNPAALNIIQNATIMQAQLTARDNVITQDTTVSPLGGAILYNPTFTHTIGGEYGHCFTNGNRILTMHKDDIDPRDVITATMGMVCTQGEGPKVSIRSCGSEIFVAAVVSHFIKSEELGPKLKHSAVRGYVSALRGDGGADYVAFIKNGNLINFFNDHPVQFAYTKEGTGETAIVKLAAINLDVDNYAIISPEVLDNIHDASLMAMFNVPIMGVFK